jgi:CheY-like chemotaxis protein
LLRIEQSDDPSANRWRGPLRREIKLRSIFHPSDFSQASEVAFVARKTVLFVEDDEFVAHEYGQSLTTMGFKVSYACDPRTALREAQQFRHFDFVIIDIRVSPSGFADRFQSVIGVKTGLLLADELTNNYLPESTLLALTNSERADDREWFETRGFAFHVKREMGPKKFASYLRRRAMMLWGDWMLRIRL